MHCIRCAAPQACSRPTSCRSLITTLNVAEAVAEIKELAAPADVRAILAYEEAHKNRHGVVSAAQTRVAAIAQEVVGIT